MNKSYLVTKQLIQFMLIYGLNTELSRCLLPWCVEAYYKMLQDLWPIFNEIRKKYTVCHTTTQLNEFGKQFPPQNMRFIVFTGLFFVCLDSKSYLFIQNLIYLYNQFIQSVINYDFSPGNVALKGFKMYLDLSLNYSLVKIKIY